MTPTSVLIEVCVDDIEGAKAAISGGADRLELAASLREGGLSPSAGLIERVCALTSIPIVALLRPRGGDFHYSVDELAVLAADIRFARDAGLQGIAMGVLRRDGHLDRDALARLSESAHPLILTCHRAFDFTPNLEDSLDTLIDLGFSHVLTSGGAATAVEGAPAIASLVRHSASRISILPGGGIRPANVRALLSATGVTELHLSATSWRGFLHPSKPNLSVDGSPPPGPYWTRTTDPSQIQDLRARLSS